MAKRFTDSEKWSVQWFRRLPVEMKLAWQYLTDQCDVAGVIRLDRELADFQIGAAVDWDEFIEICGDRLLQLPCGKLWIVEFMEFQYGKQLSRACAPHNQIIRSVEKHDLDIEYAGIVIVDSGNTPSSVRSRITDKFRASIFELDAFTCQYCGVEFAKSELRPDHVIPVAKGGLHSIENIVTACVTCNARKSDKDVFEFIARHKIRPLDRLNKILITLKEKDKDKDKDKDMVLEKGGVGENKTGWIVPDWLDFDDVRSALGEFAAMRKKIGKPIKDLANSSRILKQFRDKDQLLRAIDVCIGNEYQGLKPEYGDGPKSTEKKSHGERALEGTW